MIQRIQTAFLLLTALAALLFLTGPFLTFIDTSGGQLNLAISGTLVSESERIAFFPLIPFFAVIIPLAALLIIFLYSKRQLQIRLTGILVAMEIGFIAVTAISVIVIISKKDAFFSSWIKSLIPLIQFVMTLLALRAIRKDEDLVKSYERIR